MKRLLTVAVGIVAGTTLLASSAFANLPVLVEGNCLGSNAQAGLRTAVPPGTCGDFDGDGRLGTAEDTDEADRVFGTINGALGAGTVEGVSTGANQNGRVTIVSSGVFPEVVSITAAGGNVTVQAAPGVEANIDAVLQGGAGAGNIARQNAPGIVVNAPSNRYVVIRNITSRNWTSGIQVLGASRVAIENVRMENNINYGVEVADSARVAISKSEVLGTGFRNNPMTGNFPSAANAPNPGKGIEFDDQSSGSVFLTTVAGSFAAGISNMTGRRFAVCTSLVNVFDNAPNFEPFSISCPPGQESTKQAAAKKAAAKKAAAKKVAAKSKKKAVKPKNKKS